MIGSNMYPSGINFGRWAANSNIILGYETYIAANGNWRPMYAKWVML
jgi:hypothetical protein